MDSEIVENEHQPPISSNLVSNVEENSVISEYNCSEGDDKLLKDNGTTDKNTNIEVNEISTKPSTSKADLLYAEYTEDKKEEERKKIGRIFEKKTKKPVILYTGKSPLIEKVTNLLKTFETADERIPGWGETKKFPIIQMHCLLKRKDSSDSDSDDDMSNTRMIFYGKKNTDGDCSSSSSSSDDDSSDDDEESNIIKPNKIKILDEDSSETECSSNPKVQVIDEDAYDDSDCSSVETKAQLVEDDDKQNLQNKCNLKGIASEEIVTIDTNNCANVECIPLQSEMKSVDEPLPKRLRLD